MTPRIFMNIALPPLVLALTLVPLASAVDFETASVSTRIEGVLATVEVSVGEEAEIRLRVWESRGSKLLVPKPGEYDEYLRAKDGHSVEITGLVEKRSIEVETVRSVFFGIVKPLDSEESQPLETSFEDSTGKNGELPVATLDVFGDEYLLPRNEITEALVSVCKNSEALVIGSARADGDAVWFDVESYHAVLQGELTRVEVERTRDGETVTAMESLFVTDMDEEFQLSDTELTKEIRDQLSKTPMVVWGTLRASEDDFWTLEPAGYSRLFSGHLATKSSENAGKLAYLRMSSEGKKVNYRIDLSNRAGRIAVLPKRGKQAVIGETYERDGESWIRVRAIRP